MAIEDFFPIRRRKKEEEYEELSIDLEEEPEEKVNVRVEKLSGVEDAERIVRYVKKGFIVFLKTKELQKKQLAQFQMAVLKMKRLCKNYGFDIVGTEDGYLILAPKFAVIERQ